MVVHTSTQEAGQVNFEFKAILDYNCKILQDAATHRETHTDTHAPPPNAGQQQQL